MSRAAQPTSTPAFVTSSASSDTDFSVRATSAMSYPARAKRSALERPSPGPAPMTSANGLDTAVSLGPVLGPASGGAGLAAVTGSPDGVHGPSGPHVRR